VRHVTDNAERSRYRRIKGQRQRAIAADPIGSRLGGEVEDLGSFELAGSGRSFGGKPRWILWGRVMRNGSLVFYERYSDANASAKEARKFSSEDDAKAWMLNYLGRDLRSGAALRFVGEEVSRAKSVEEAREEFLNEWTGRVRGVVMGRDGRPGWALVPKDSSEMFRSYSLEALHVALSERARFADVISGHVLVHVPDLDSLVAGDARMAIPKIEAIAQQEAPGDYELDVLVSMLESRSGELGIDELAGIVTAAKILSDES